MLNDLDLYYYSVQSYNKWFFNRVCSCHTEKCRTLVFQHSPCRLGLYKDCILYFSVWTSHPVNKPLSSCCQFRFDKLFILCMCTDKQKNMSQLYLKLSLLIIFLSDNEEKAHYDYLFKEHVLDVCDSAKEKHCGSIFVKFAPNIDENGINVGKFFYF